MRYRYPRRDLGWCLPGRMVVQTERSQSADGLLWKRTRKFNHTPIQLSIQDLYHPYSGHSSSCQQQHLKFNPQSQQICQETTVLPPRQQRRRDHVHRQKYAPSNRIIARAIPRLLSNFQCQVKRALDTAWILHAWTATAERRESKASRGDLG